MGFASKMFNAGFAGAVGAPILEQQKSEIALLRDRLNQIATTERAMQVQELSGNQQATRNRFSEQMANVRHGITQSGLNARHIDTQRHSTRSDAADLGVEGAESMSVEDALAGIASTQLEIRNAENDETKRDNFTKLFDQYTSLKSRFPGLSLSMDDVAAGNVDFDQLSNDIRTEQARIDQVDLNQRMAGGDAPAGVLNMLEGMSPDLGDELVNTLAQSGDYTEREISQFRIATALSRNQQEIGGVNGARLDVENYIDTIVNAMSPPGTGGGGVMMMFSAEGGLAGFGEQQQKIKDTIEQQLVEGSLLDMQLKEKHGVGVVDAVPGFTSVTAEQMQAAQLRIQDRQSKRAAENAEATPFPAIEAAEAQARQKALMAQAQTLIGKPMPDPVTGQPTEALITIDDALSIYRALATEMEKGTRPSGIDAALTLDDVRSVIAQLRELAQAGGGIQ